MIGLGSWEMSLDEPTITYTDGVAGVLGLGERVPLSLEEFTAMVLPEDRPILAAAIRDCLRDGDVSAEYRIRRPDGAVRRLLVQGETVPAGNGEPIALRGAVFDITQQREAERQRLALNALFEQAFESAPIGMALVSPETGRFMRVNDALCALLGRPRDELVELSTVQVTHPDHRAADADGLRGLMEGRQDDYHCEKRYVRPDGTEVWVAVHVGAVRAADGTIEALFSQKIDITQVKERERELAQSVNDAEWLGRIRDALDEDRMLLYWQPIVDLRTGELVQRELLLRLRGEDGTIITPDAFLPVAERYGLMPEIDRWVIRQAVRLAAGGPVQLNLSAGSLADPAVLRELSSAIETHGVNPESLVVEVTETTMLDDAETGAAFAAQLRALGCRLALDDFGTGFAGLAYLRHLHADHLKIDIEFVRNVAWDETDERLIRGIVGLAAEFGQTTTAEGIEDERTLHKLRELGVHRGQGYLFAAPAPVEDAPPPPRREPPQRDLCCAEPVTVVKEALTALGRREMSELRRRCSPDVILRLPASAVRAGQPGVYRGHAGLDRYATDVRRLWEELRVVPTGYWSTSGAVIVFGQTIGRTPAFSVTTDTLWVCRLRGSLIATLDVFDHPASRGSTP